MSFASHLSISPDGDEPPADPLPWAPPTNEAPGTVPGGPILLRTDDVAVSLMTVRTYSIGVQIELELRLRPSAPGWPDGRDLWQAMQQLRVGVELADGTRMVNGRGSGPGAAGPRLSSAGGSGSENACRNEFWLAPMPPPGDLLVVVSHPLLDPCEGQHLIPGAALTTATSQIIELWPWEPEPTRPGDLPVPPPPLGGWFAQAMG
ncbi:MAG: hypothetical protein L6311_09295 [Cellulomonas sp.]|nr:hypothetical protein [Cellulomonas sp.]